MVEVIMIALLHVFHYDFFFCLFQWLCILVETYLIAANFLFTGWQESHWNYPICG